MTNRPVQLPAKMVKGVISAVNMVPAMIAPKNMLGKDWDQSQSQLTGHERPKEEELAGRGKLVVEQIDLSSNSGMEPKPPATGEGAVNGISRYFCKK